jgi:hypothetical protein
MYDFERVSDETRTSFEELARRVEEAITAAGLPVTISNSPTALPPAGAEIYIDGMADGLAGVWVHWCAARQLRDRAAAAVDRGDLASPHIKRSGAISEVMARALLALLQEAGFAVRTDENEYAPFAL